jgi:hypothetical protein
VKTVLDLTDRFPMRFDVERLRDELRALETVTWLDHYDKKISDGWTAIPLVSRDGSMNAADAQRVGRLGRYQRTPITERLPYYRTVLDAFQCPQGRVRISRLLPRAVIRPHRDICREAANIAFGQVRLHLPIVTNDRVVFRVGGEELRLLPGRLYYIDFTKLHSVRNDGTEPRIHLILDLQVNDFLRRVFPQPSRGERVERLILRHTLPLVWPFFRIHFALKQLFLTAPVRGPADSAREVLALERTPSP